MIKAIVTDVDGVIVGKKAGFNFPMPHTQVFQTIHELQDRRIPIVLCTAKFSHAIRGIAEAAGLDNPHIADAGALIFNPVRGRVVASHPLPKELARDIAAACLNAGAYMECYGIDEYYVQKDQVHDFTELRAKILHKPQQELDSLLDELDGLDIIKIIAVGKTPQQRAEVDKALEPFRDQISFLWGLHPAMLPARAGVITLKGVSKKHATLEVLESLRISPADALGVGDEDSDWNFMDVCGYAGSVGNNEKLQELVRTKDTSKYFVAPSIDDNGFVELIKHFESEFAKN